MSKTTNITTNADEVFRDFLDLSTKEMRQTLKKAVQTAANKLRGDTKRIFKSSLPTARNRNPKYNDTLIDAVKKSKVEETARGEISSKVHIMGTRNTGSGTYRARFFEKNI